MEKYKEEYSKRDRSVKSMDRAILFWVLKDPETGKYLYGDENGYGWTDKLDDAMAVADGEIDEAIDEVMNDWPAFKQLFNLDQAQINAVKAREKDFWAEEYAPDETRHDGIVDVWDMQYEYRNRLKPTPVYASKFHESKGGISVKELDGVKADLERALANLKAIQKKLAGTGTGHDYIFVNGRPFSNAEDALAYQASLLKKRS